MDSHIKPICFYLPQYHPIAENDEWWGAGFTEWTNVRKAVPNFIGHDQPRIPGELGYYDLRDHKVQEKQAELAAEYGIYGFCFYYYWFNGRRVLEQPLNQWKDNKNITLPYCVCWANENWTRRWDGLDSEVLLPQNHTPKDDVEFFQSLIPLFADERYIKVNGAPMLLIYRVDLFPDMLSTAARWRELAREAGYPDVHLCAVQFHGVDDPRRWGFDAAVEFPPHNFLLPDNRPEQMPTFTNKAFQGGVVDYTKVIAQALTKPTPEFCLYRGLVPAWDNTARRQHTGHLMLNATPFEYEYWLTKLIHWTRRRHQAAKQFIFINAWNEWGEGTYLEPDVTNGRLYLQATKSALDAEPLIEDLLRKLQESTGDADKLRTQLAELFESRLQALVAMQALLRETKATTSTLPSLGQYILDYAKQYKKARYVIRKCKAMSKAVKDKVPGVLKR